MSELLSFSRVGCYYLLFLATLDAGVSPRHRRPATRTGLNYEDTKSVAMQIMADLFFNCFELGFSVALLWGQNVHRPMSNNMSGQGVWEKHRGTTA